MDSILYVADAILRIGGALCVLMLIVVIWRVLAILGSVSRVVQDVEYKYHLVQHRILTPFRYLSRWIERDDDRDDDLS